MLDIPEVLIPILAIGIECAARKQLAMEVGRWHRFEEPTQPFAVDAAFLAQSDGHFGQLLESHRRQQTFGDRRPDTLMECPEPISANGTREIKTSIWIARVLSVFLMSLDCLLAV